MTDEILASLKDLANACAQELSATKFVELWQRAAERRIEEIEINIPLGLPPDKVLGEMRFQQLLALHKTNRMGAFVKSLIDRDLASSLRKPLLHYVGLITIDIGPLREDANLDEARKQAILSNRDAFMKTEDILDFSIRAFPRICCIVGIKQETVNGLLEAKPIGGTGFLVGADLVLTNYHVVDGLIEMVAGRDEPQQRPGSAEQFSLFFDHSTSSELVGHTIDHAGTVRVAPAAQWLVACSRPTETKADWAERLDFALIRLSSPIGKAALNKVDGVRRGWFKIPPIGGCPDLRVETRVASPQHPAGVGHRLDIGRSRGLFAARHGRLAYDLNTGNGSSGSPILVRGGVVAALHEAGPPEGLPKPQPPDCFNRGILLESIAHKLRQHVSNDDIPAPLEACWTIRTESRAEHPLIGRNEFLDWIDASREGRASPVRVILGEPRTGKSFSVDILRAKLLKTNDIVLVFTAGKDRAQAFELTDDPRLILAEVARALQFDGLETIPPPPPEVTFGATASGRGAVIDLKPNPWASADLTSWLQGKLAGSQRDYRVWIVIDVRPDFSFGTRVQDFLTTWTTPVGDDHPFNIFRWLFIGADPTGKVPPQARERLDPRMQLTEDSFRSFVRSAYRAVGYPDLTPDADIVIVPLAFRQINIQATDFWGSVLTVANSMVPLIKQLKVHT